MSKSLSTFLLSGLILFITLFATDNDVLAALPVQSNDCDYVLPKTTHVLNGETANLKPGDIVCLGSGTRPNMKIRYVRGTKEKPIIIKNNGGPLTIETTTYGISIEDNEHIRLTGTGDPNVKYGIRISGGIKAHVYTTDIEIDHLEILKSRSSGIIVHTDPQCDTPKSWRDGGHVTKNVSIHDNYVHNTVNEGLYIGHTFYHGYTKNCGDGTTETGFPTLIDGLEVYNNVIENTGWDGIQVSSAPFGNARVYNNTVSNFGQTTSEGNNIIHGNGIQINSANIKLFNNKFSNGPGYGLAVFGEGHRIYNNVFVNAAKGGIFGADQGLDSPHSPGVKGFEFINNTIINPGKDGIRLNNNIATSSNQIRNNIIANPGSGYFLTKVKKTISIVESNNLFAKTVAEVKFNNPSQGDYQLQATSPAVDKGMDTASYGVNTDIDRFTRPFGQNYDIGAYEYHPASGPLNNKVFVPLIIK